MDQNLRGRRLAVAGLMINLALAGAKFLGGVFGHSYALIADAAESLADIAGSAIIWGGLHVSSRPASTRHPYGYGKAEALAALAVGMMVLGAGLWISVESIREIRTPHLTPAPWTLALLAGVIITKETLYRIVAKAAAESTSGAVEADAWHHRADALTSAAAFIGIALALAGRRLTGDDRFASADDWAALLAGGIIVYNAVRLIAGPGRELLDAQDPGIVERAAEVARGVTGVRRVQKAFARKSGTRYWIDMHVWVDGAMSVRESHALAHAVKEHVRAALPRVHDVLIHIEPDAAATPDPDGTASSPGLPGT